MGKIVLITGGARSGKSEYAQQMAEKISGTRMFIATCPISDKELEERITKHREARKNKGWETIEETINLKDSIQQAREYDVVLVDCLTLWINNLMYNEINNAIALDEKRVDDLCGGIVYEARMATGTVIFVTNEVGMGIVPDNEIARRYRDLLGRCNQIIAASADEVILMVCGMPVPIKCS